MSGGHSTIYQVLILAHPPSSLIQHQVDVIDLYPVMGKDLISDLDLPLHSSRTEDVCDVFGLDVDQLRVGPSALMDTIFHINATETGFAVY